MSPTNHQRQACDYFQVPFDRLCVATGASPRAAVSHERVLTIRDTDSVATLNARLSTARRVLVVGNGGIALEFVCVFPSQSPSLHRPKLFPLAPPSQKPFACPLQRSDCNARDCSRADTRAAHVNLARTAGRNLPLSRRLSPESRFFSSLSRRRRRFTAPFTPSGSSSDLARVSSLR